MLSAVVIAAVVVAGAAGVCLLPQPTRDRFCPCLRCCPHPIKGSRVAWGAGSGGRNPAGYHGGCYVDEFESPERGRCFDPHKVVAHMTEDSEENGRGARGRKVSLFADQPSEFME